MKKLCCIIACWMMVSGVVLAQHIPSPKEHFGFNIGDDYMLANYTQTEAYFKKLGTSPRAKYVDIGLTEEGRHQLMLIVSSPENMKKLEFYKGISQKLARAENLTDAEAHKLSEEGKAIVWIDGGLHASETVGAHQLIQTAYDLVSRNDEETKRLLDHDIVLFVHANPDGQELISNWYMAEKDPKLRNMNVPRLWEKYIGHDNNRDFYMMNMKETQNITRQQYLVWLPQIIYNHHQAGPAGSVVAGPPFRDPFNYVYDPLLVTSIDAVGSAMNSRLNKEGKPGYTQRSGTEFSTWWNGGLRTATYFHNMVGLLTEIIGSPTPSRIPVVPERLIPSSATPYPVLPQEWHYKQSIDYSVSLNYAVLDYAARNSDALLYNMYQMGKNSILRGSRDNWTLSPKRADEITEAAKSSQVPDTARGGRGGRGGGAAGAVTVGGGRGGNIALKFFDTVLRNPANRDPRGYIMTADPPDPGTLVRFINTCLRSGLVVQKATAAFTVNGKSYPVGSYVIKADQAFRPEVLDRFEPQDHPNDFLYPGGPPIRPYDMTGWTLAYQMGIQFDRILDGFTGPFQRIPYGQLQPMPSAPVPATASAGYLISGLANNSFIAVNDLFNAGAQVSRTTTAEGGFPAGAFYVEASVKVKASLDKSAKELGVAAIPVSSKPVNLQPIQAARIGVWDQYGGSIPSGWIRWMMEQYHFPFRLVYPQELDGGDLKTKFDVLVFVGGAIPVPGRAGGFGGGAGGGRGGAIPPEFANMQGRVSVEKTVPQLKSFLEAGGTIVTIGTSANLAYDLNLPVKNALVDNVNGREVPYSGDKFYVPGAVLRASLDTKQPANWGMPAEADVMYDSSPAFHLDADASSKGVTPLMWFSTDKPLRSGWAFGQKYLKNDVAAFQAKVGSGMLYSFGPEITFRGQSHGTFKLLFNELYKK